MAKSKNKTHLCPECGDEFTKRTSLQKTCPKVPCAISFTKKKQALKMERENKKIHKELKQAAFDLPAIKGRMEHWINKIVRLIDYGHPCMSSLVPYGQYTVNAGHFVNVGANESLRFNLLNIWAQSLSDNKWGGGAKTEYRHNLIKTFGQELMDEIDGLTAKYPKIGFNKLDLMCSLTVARRIALRLEKENKIYTLEERVSLRKKFNEEIGVYL